MTAIYFKHRKIVIFINTSFRYMYMVHRMHKMKNSHKEKYMHKKPHIKDGIKK